MIIITGVPDYFMLLCCGYKELTKSYSQKNKSNNTPR
ncbi:hypothetical protein SAMN05216323_10491 [Williamwhitmania taraxaci]|uniref:Uncharacterized protein n=1 Tax=Williamwhitmania taraxaci TaxID=1640674 RepID=A0A1G6P7L8_9BACT|nr:hypothetical protein SAMN05216323_10491 [Williamwhitmania taraxaci]